MLEINIENIPTHRIRFDYREEKEKPDTVATKIKEEQSAQKQETEPEKKPAPAPAKLPTLPFTDKNAKIAIIVDDIGLKKDPIDRLLNIDARLNFAILPDLPYSEYGAEMAHKRGWDVLLHLPMEPKHSSGYTGADAGEGALLVGLSKSEMLAKLDRKLSSVPHVKGVNNHMGSKFTENGELMELVLKRINSKGLFFIDSRTSKFTTGASVAKKIGMKVAERDVFLDNGVLKGRSYVKSQIDQLIEVARKRGYAIGICHPHSETIAALTEKIPQIKEKVDIVPVSNLVK